MYFINVIEKPKVTIITAVLNGVKTIETTIQSVLCQNYDRIEYIIIDGGSVDGTLSILENYSEFIDVIISEPDSGIANAFNKGLKLANGEIIGIINSDDWLEQNAIENLVNAYGIYPYFDIYYGNCRLIGRKTLDNIYKPANGHIRLIERMSIMHPATFVKKSAYVKYGLFNEDFQIAMDYEWLLKSYIKGALFLYLDKIFTNHRPGGLSHTNYKVGRQECLKAQEMYIEK